MTKKAMIAALKERLATDDRWALRALSFIYAQQTFSEQLSEQTTEHNGVGFCGPHAEILTSFSKQFQRKGQLSEKQMRIVRRLMPSYAGQIARLNDVEKIVGALTRRPAVRSRAEHVEQSQYAVACMA